MQLDLEQKIVVVTGSSSGIGLQIAADFVAEGAIVILNGRDEAKLASAKAKIKAADYLAGDVCKAAFCERFVDTVIDQYGGIDHLICNVGSGASVPPGEETTQEWQRLLQINLFSTTQMVAAATKILSDRQGSVVCISSICGVEALGCPIAYAGAKAALMSYVKNQSKLFGKKGVRINSVIPGNILFEGSVWERKLAQSADQVDEMLRNEVALSQLGTPEDVAAMAVFLCSARARFITGAGFVVDGGQLR